MEKQTLIVCCAWGTCGHGQRGRCGAGSKGGQVLVGGFSVVRGDDRGRGGAGIRSSRARSTGGGWSASREGGLVCAMFCASCGTATDRINECQVLGEVSSQGMRAPQDFSRSHGRDHPDTEHIHLCMTLPFPLPHSQHPVRITYHARTQVLNSADRALRTAVLPRAAQVSDPFLHKLYNRVENV